MLEKVHIKAFRSCADLSLEFATPIVALVGRNGAGKTNILKGIEWLARTATGFDPGISDEDSFSWFHMPRCDEASFDIKLSGKRYRYSLARDTSVARDPEATRFEVDLRENLVALDAAGTPGESNLFNRKGETLEISGRAEPYRIGRASPSLPVLAALLPEEDAFRSCVVELRDFLASVRYYVLDEPQTAFPGPDSRAMIGAAEYSKWRAQPETGNSASATMRLLHLFRNRKSDERFAELRSLLGPDGLGLLRKLRFERYDVPGPRRKANQQDDQSIYVLEVVPTGADPSTNFSYGELSAGTRRIIRLLVSILADNSSVMLLEQPEDCIHAGLMSKLLGLLKAYSKDAKRTIVFTTHSATMFNALEPENIRLVTMQKGATHLRALSVREIRSAKKFLEDEGSLSDFIESVEED